ncbi:energy-coupling factor transporter transmembrane component T [uncultured Anaerofustis sp.]|uniref:energy-coupling factor transporter transmembrane component T n=1 Tax=uncultured Anaerofustis sp. TaxID=904996 RepID=UPI0025E630F8|nr:energy-coupling factor transporter transmembrane component T [uncultured Anaerofustis sp.]
MRENTMFYNHSAFVNMLYFIVVMGMTMFFMHPAVLFISFISSFSYSLYLGGAKSLKFSAGVLLPLLIFIIILNPLINHQGSTILFYINNKMITKEAIYYGFFAGFMIIDMFLIFSSFNKIMTGDKIVYLFKGTIPKLSLMFSMTLRFIPRYKEEFNKIKASQKCIGEGLDDGNIFDRIRHGVNIISALITFALEDGIDSANTMVARGYELKGKSSYKNEKFTNVDKVLLIFMMIIIVILIMGIYNNAFHIIFFSDFSFTSIGGSNIIYFISYLIFAFIPLLIEIKEEIVWNLLKQKI